jgi:hypothetical protein
MGDFFTAPPGYPEVPPDPPTPAPNFTQIGQGLGIGLATTGALGGLLGSLFDILVKWLTWALGWIVRQVINLMAYFITVLGNIENDQTAQFGNVVKATIHNLLGVWVDAATVNSRIDNGSRAAAAQEMGKALINGLFAAVNVNVPGVVLPSDKPAIQYLGTAMNIELTGWLESWFTDAASYHLLEKYGDLKDGIIRIMGISRMSRQAFQPLVKTFIHDPYQALINTNYRPKPMQEALAIGAYYRNVLSRTDLTRILAPQGYTEDEITYAIDQHRKFLSDGDIEYLLARGIWDVNAATQYLSVQGWILSDAQNKIAIIQDKALQKYRVEATTLAVDAYVKGDLDFGSLQNLVGSSGLTQVEQSWILANANLKLGLKKTHLSLGQIEQGILDGVMNLNDLETWAIRNGMPQNEELDLELMLLYKQTKQTVTAAAKAAAAQAKATAAQAKAAATAAKAKAAAMAAEDKGVSVTQAETLVQDGFWTISEFQNYLRNKSYGNNAIADLTELLQTKLQKASTGSSTVANVAAAAKAKGLNLAEVQKAVVAGILTTDDLSAWLTNNGFDAADAAVLVELTEDTVTAAQTKAAAKAAAALKAGEKQIDLAALERAVRIGITPIDTYNAALTAAGYDSMSITLLDGLLNAQIAADKAAAAKKSSATVTVGGKTASLSQVANEVVQGIRPIGDYTTALSIAGYDGIDQVQLTQLLQLRVNHAQHALALHSDADGKAVAKGISLGSAEAAVLGGTNKLADYDAMLVTLGYDATDRATLEALLMAKAAAKNITLT